MVNVSEGRRLKHIDAISDLLRTEQAVYVLHRDIGRDANRTVFTIVGIAREVFSSIERLYLYSMKHLDISKHQGSHPRIGIIDVVPFIPIKNITEEDLTLMVRAFSKRISASFDVPIFYYGMLSSNHEQKTLHDLRKRNLEESIGITIFPDKGTSKPHPQLGASCITVRKFMGAYNINLSTSNLKDAKALAQRIRKNRNSSSAQDIDLSQVKFLGWYVEEYGCCQISTNIYDLSTVTLIELYRYVSKEAAAMSLAVMGSELIGMIPAAGIYKGFHSLDQVLEELGLDKVRSFDKKTQILDYRLEHLDWKTN